MTVIVAKKFKDKIVVAADKQLSYGYDNKMENVCKIFKSNGTIFGAAGYALHNSLLQIFTKTKIIENVEKEEDIIEFLIEFNDWARKKDINNNTNSSSYIMATKKQLFSTHGLYIKKENSFCSIGCGMFVALGAMECNSTVKKAVEIASKYDSCCSGGVDILEIKLK